MLCELPLPAALSLTANSDLVADGGNLILASALSGTHTLTTNSVAGTTTVTLTANSSGFTGIIDVATGTLHNAGTLAYATANVEQQGTLTGTVGMIAGPLLTTTGRATSGTGALINWTNDGSESDFVIESKIGTGTYSIVGYADGTDSAMLVTGLIVSTGYTFRVTGYDAHGVTGENNITSTITTDSTDDSGVYEVSLPDTSGTTGLALIHGPNSRPSVFTIAGDVLDIVAGGLEEAVIQALSGRTNMYGDSTYLSAFALNFHFDMSFSGGGYTGPAITFEDAYPGGGTVNSFIEIDVGKVGDWTANFLPGDSEAPQDTQSPSTFSVAIAGDHTIGGTLVLHVDLNGSVGTHVGLTTNGGGTSWYGLTPDGSGNVTIAFAAGVMNIDFKATPDGTTTATGSLQYSIYGASDVNGAQLAGASYFQRGGTVENHAIGGGITTLLISAPVTAHATTTITRKGSNGKTYSITVPTEFIDGAGNLKIPPPTLATTGPTVLNMTIQVTGGTTSNQNLHIVLYLGPKSLEWVGNTSPILKNPDGLTDVDGVVKGAVGTVQNGALPETDILYVVDITDPDHPVNVGIDLRVGS